MEVLGWAELLNQNAEKVTEKNASNLLLALYLIASIITKKSHFLMAFLLCEIAGLSYNLQLEYGYKLFIVYSFVYAILLIKIKQNNYSNETYAACAIMFIFDGVMAIDSFIYYETETILYIFYIHILIFIHLLIIFTLFKWEHAWTNIRNIISSIFDKFLISYNYTHFCYNIKNKQRK